MKIQEKYDWVDFYKSFGKELLKYRNDRKSLIELIKKIFQDLSLELPTLEKHNNIEDIDPFTVYGLFNKNIKIDKKIEIINLDSRKYITYNFS